MGKKLIIKTPITNVSEDYLLNLPNKDSGSYIIATTEDIPNNNNLENGEGGYSLQQKANITNHSKGGLAIGANSIALGVGDTYDIGISSVSGTALTIATASRPINPNWQNMVAEYNGEYRRITAVDASNNIIIIESAFSSSPSTIAIITQVAMGNASIAEGEYSQAFGEGAHAEGIATKAVGNASHSEGFYTLANQAYSHAEGQYTIAAGIAQTVVGKYNNINFNDLFIVGKGSEGSRSDAFIVRSDGRATIDHDPVNNMDVATKQYVDNADSALSTAINAKYTKPSGGIPASDLAQTYVVKQNSRKVVYATDGTASGGVYPDITISYSAGLNANCLVQRDADKQIMVPDTPTQNNHAASKLYVDSKADNDHYPTTFTWTNGTTAGPTGSLTGNTGFTAVSFGAIPAASNSQSGVVTTGKQTFAGTKTFESIIFQNNFLAPPQIRATGPGAITITPIYTLNSQMILDSSEPGSLEIKNNGLISLDNLMSDSSHQSSYLQLPQNKGTSQNPATIATLSDIPVIPIVDLTGL